MINFHRAFRSIKIALIFFLPGLFPQFSFAEDAKVDIFGKWRVAKVLDSADIAGLSEKQAKTLVGKALLIDSEKFEFDGQVCLSPMYERTQEKTSVYFRESLHASTENLHLGEQVTVVDAKCTFIYPRSRDRIMFFWKGFFFDAVRQRGYRSD